MGMWVVLCETESLHDHIISTYMLQGWVLDSGSRNVSSRCTRILRPRHLIIKQKITSHYILSQNGKMDAIKLFLSQSNITSKSIAVWAVFSRTHLL